MRIRLILTLAGLAISFAMPALAQQQNTVDPEVRQQIEAAVKNGHRTIGLLLQALNGLFTFNSESHPKKLLPAPPVAKRSQLSSHLSTLPVGSCGTPVGILLPKESRLS